MSRRGGGYGYPNNNGYNNRGRGGANYQGGPRPYRAGPLKPPARDMKPVLRLWENTNINDKIYRASHVLKVATTGNILIIEST